MQNYKQQKNQKLKGLLTGKVIASVMIALIPVGLYLDLIIKELGIEKFDLGIFSFDGNYFNSFDIFVWVLMQKFVPILLILIWLFTSRQKWLYILFVPLSIYLFQFISIFRDERYIIDIPILGIIIIQIILFGIIYKIRQKWILSRKLLENKLKTGDLLFNTLKEDESEK